MHVNNLVILLHPSAVSLFGHQLNVVARQFKRTSEIRQELLLARGCWHCHKYKVATSCTSCLIKRERITELKIATGYKLCKMEMRFTIEWPRRGGELKGIRRRGVGKQSRLNCCSAYSQSGHKGDAAISEAKS